MQVEIGKQYKTKASDEVRIYATDCGGEYPIHGAYRIGDIWLNQSWTADGKAVVGQSALSDLIEVKPRIQREVWLNVYPEKVQDCTHNTKELADKNCCGDRIACVKITIDCEEGEGL